jgi:serine/threonine protein kinase
MVDVIESWLASGQYAVINDVAVIPRRLDDLSPVPLTTKGEQAFAYYLIDDLDKGWVLKKFFPETRPDDSYLDAIQTLIPERPGFESGFERDVLRSSSVSSTAYSQADFRTWIDGSILMPQVMVSSWADLSDSIRQGDAVLSRVERLLLCQKLAEIVGWLESAGLAHRDLSNTNVMMDALNIEIHLIDWDSLYHSTLEMPANTSCGTQGYIAPFVNDSGTGDIRTSWQENADRFALARLNVEIMVMGAGLSIREISIDQNELQNRTGKRLEAVRGSLRHISPTAVEFLDAAITARSFAECPSPSDWIELAERELASSGQTIWDRESSAAVEEEKIYAADYEPHFVEFNESAFVKIDRGAFVKAPAAR